MLFRSGVSDDEIRETVRRSIEILAPGFHIPYVYVIGNDCAHQMSVMEEVVSAFEKKFFQN